MSTPHSFSKFVDIVRALRGPEGCPWDKQQTHESLIRWAIEESYELSEAIQEKNSEAIKGELGDLLLQVVLHSVIAEEAQNFHIDDVIKTISEKMIRRHPHVFSNEKANLDEVYKNWEKIKSQENLNKKEKKHFGISPSLPALLYSQKIGEKTKAQNFDWSHPKEVQAKVLEELSEFLEEYEKQQQEKMEEEFGDLLFSLVQLARHLNIDAELALSKSNKKFETRFFEMKKQIESEKKDFLKLTQSEKDIYWEKVKNKN